MRKTIALTLIIGLISAPSMAAPLAPSTVKGSATFQQDGDNWTITTTSDRTVINWNSFSVAAGAEVRFQQPRSTSSVLNRVLGSRASYINGLLTSNGRVYLLNPNGIIIGRTGVIQVADFVGSTLPISNAEFLAGKDANFKGVSLASIENYGKIEAVGGDIYLIAANVVNAGTLTAASGSVNLLAGTDVLLTQDHKIFVRPSLLTGDGDIGVMNSGAIDAVVATLQADGNMYALAINNTGVIRATGSMLADGRVLLRAKGGSLANTGSLTARTVKADGKTVGGQIQVLGDDIAITGQARIDASGDLGGGRVLIGGDLQGDNPSIPNARTTFVGRDAAVAADALARGDGGTVIVWSDDATTVIGAISARGSAGGTGGFVETSGGTLDVGGLDLSCGNGGTWLLDPPLVIDAALATTISGQLSGDTNVKYAGQDGITVNADIIATPTMDTTYLWLGSNTYIAINADIDVGVGRLYLQGQSGVTQAAGKTLAAANLWLSGGDVFMLNQPGNDFGTVGIAVSGVDSFVSIQDANDIRLGNVRSAHGISVLGGEVHITTPNGHILANGLFAPGVVTGYHALGNVAIAETSIQSNSYEIRISNTTPYSQTPSDVAPFADLTVAQLDGLTPETNVAGSAVRIEFGDLAGDSLGYSWDFRTNENYGQYTYSANDYSFVVVKPTGPGMPQVVADVEKARTSAKQDSGAFSWKTGWGDETTSLNGTEPYRLSFGAMDVRHMEYESKLYLRNIYFTGHQRPTTTFIFERLFDHVEDFLYVRPDARVSSVGGQLLAPVLDEVSTYFDESAQATDHKYFYQSIGSIYQIPR